MSLLHTIESLGVAARVYPATAAAEKQSGWRGLEAAITRFCDSKSDYILDCDFNDDDDEFQINIGFNEVYREDESTVYAAFSYKHDSQELSFQMGSFSVKRKVPADAQIIGKIVVGTLTQVISFLATAITAVTDKRADAEQKIEALFQSRSSKHFIEVNLAWAES